MAGSDDMAGRAQHVTVDDDPHRQAADPPTPRPPLINHARPKPIRRMRLPGAPKHRHAWSASRGAGYTKPVPNPADNRARRKAAKQARRKNR